MNKFLKNISLKFLLFLISLTLLVGTTVYFNYNHPVDYPAAILPKYKRLDSLKNTPKIIICGGSSSAYGINSKVLEKTFLKPVVNTSLGMSLGSQFHLNLTKDYLCKGDVVLYIPEYEFYYGKEAGDDFLYTTTFYYPNIIKDFTKNQNKKTATKLVKLSVDFYIGLIKKAFKNSSHKTSLQYHRASYDVIGDNISLIDIKASKIKKEETTRFQRLKKNKVSALFIKELKAFNKLCISKGVKFIIGFPPIEESQFDEHFLEAIHFLKNKTKIQFVGNPIDYIYDVNLFYDSSYHLNGNGRVVRTEKLKSALKKVLN